MMMICNYKKNYLFFVAKKALRDLPTPQQFELKAFWGMLLYLFTTRGIRLIVLSAAWLENMKRNDGNGSKGNKTLSN